MRVCFKCKVEKNGEEFGKKCTYCKICESERWKKRSDEKKEQYASRKKRKYFIENVKVCKHCKRETPGRGKFCNYDCKFKHHIVIKNECWEWQAFKHSNGYGTICYDGKNEYVHRASYKYYKEPIPIGKYVCHTCDNRNCINPLHLFVGTPQDNMDDAKSKGRLAKGEKVRGNKWTKDQISELKKLSKKGMTQNELSKIFNMNCNYISKILRGLIWRNA